MVFKLGCPLDSRIADLANFRRIKFIPFMVMKFLVEFLNEFRMDKIDECITDITIVLSL